MIPEVFQKAIDKRPIAVLACATIERLFDPLVLNKLFLEHAKVQYQRNLLFSAVVEMMFSVILRYVPSVYNAYRANKDKLGVSDQSVYNKLQNMEPEVSAALVAFSAQEGEKVIDELKARVEPWVPGYRVRILDGNHIEGTHHRIKETREIHSAPLPGKALVVLDPETGLATQVFLTQDGHAQERSLLDEVLETVKPKDVWIADRNFCTLNFLTKIAEKEAFYIIRQHGKLKEKLEGEREFKGMESSSKVYEQANQLIFEEKIQSIRRITVELDKPTSDGVTIIHIFTNLPATISAVRVAELYHKRWTIEKLFLEVKNTLECEINALCYPKAALFVLCMALMASNAVAIMKAALRSIHGEEAVDQTSGYYMALEIKQAYDGLMVFLPEECWRIFRTMSLAEFVQALKYIASHVKMEKYKKHPTKPRKPKTKRSKNKDHPHVSTYQILLNRDL